MKILNRYILREAFLYFSVGLSAFLGLLLTLRMLKFASLIVNKGVDAHQILGVFVAIIPTFLEIAIPMATLLGIMMAFSRLSGDSEIVVMRGSGISILQLVRPVIFFGVATALAGFVVSTTLKPWGYKHLSEVLFDIARTKSISGLTEGIFNPMGELTIYAEKIDYYSGGLTRVLIDDRRDPLNRRIILSQTGRITSDDKTQTITLLLHDGVIHELTQNKYLTTRFNDNALSMDADEVLQTNDKNKDISQQELSMPEIRSWIRKINDKLADPDASWSSTQTEAKSSPLGAPPTQATDDPTPKFMQTRADAIKKLHRMRTELGGRYSMPIASLILALVALPLGILPARTQKTWGAGLSLLLGLGVFVIYYGVLSVGLTTAERGSIAPVVALWLPNLVCLAVGVFFIWRIGTEKWHSIPDAIFSSISGLVSKVIRKRA